jgi:hypothetical protein
MEFIEVGFGLYLQAGVDTLVLIYSLLWPCEILWDMIQLSESMGKFTP